MFLAIIIALVVLGLLLGWFTSQALLTVVTILPFVVAVVLLGIAVITFPREVQTGATDIVAAINHYAPVVVAWAWYPALGLVGLATIIALIQGIREPGPGRWAGVLATVFAGLAVTLVMVQMRSVTPGPEASVLVSAMLGLIIIAVFLHGPLLVTALRSLTLAAITRGQQTADEAPV